MKKNYLYILAPWMLLTVGTVSLANATIVNTTNTTDILNAIGVPTGTTATYSGDSLAFGFSTSTLANFPLGSDSTFGIVSTGRVSDISTANTSGSQGSDLGVSGTSGDKSMLNLTLPVPQNAAAIGFNFTFLSEEYPEYVGSSYNDNFRASLAGNNIALDTNGNPVEINNNFFDASLTPTGTFFDGQTPPLEVRAALPSGTNGGNVNLAFSVEDIGDGIFDTAVFINGIEFLFPQTVYVEFGEATAEIPVLTTPTYTKPDAGLSTDEQTEIINDLNTIYDDFLIDFTTTRPTEGNFSTLNVGGTRDDLGTHASSFGAGTLGRAEKIDLGNEDTGDMALIFSGHSAFNNNIDLLTQVLAHEAGHILGLFHVEPSDELMHPYAGGTRTDIENSAVNRAEIKSNTVTALKDGEGNFITQNSYQELTLNLGLENASVVITEPSLSDETLKSIRVVFGSLSSTVYDAKIGVIMSDDALPSIFDLGNVEAGSDIFLNIPMLDQFGVFLYGASLEGGDVDIISAINSSILPELFSIATLDYNSLSVGLTDGIKLDLFKQVTGGGYISNGSVGLQLGSAAVPEPSSFLLLLTGLMPFVRKRFSKKINA